VKRAGLSIEYQLLAWLVCAASSDIVAREVSKLLASGQIDWQQFIDEAERNGLAPWLYHNRDNGRIQFDAKVLRPLQALAVRHRHAGEIYTRVLIELLAVFHEQRIEIILLKGAALARTVYPEPGLRPMRDLDILVKEDDLVRAKMACLSVGFHEDAALQVQSVFVSHRHHLPPLERCEEGLSVSLEIHQDAFARDTFVHLNMANLGSRTQRFRLSGRMEASMLGPIDMLNHLTQHAFEPGARFKLIHAVDISRYTQIYRTTIPWADIQRCFPQIIHRLQLIHTVCPLPEEIHPLFGGSTLHFRHDRGILMPTLSNILYRGVQKNTVLDELFRPPVWWLYGYYGYSATTPFFLLLLVIHPWRVFRWLVRRAWIKILSKKEPYGNPA